MVVVLYVSLIFLLKSFITDQKKIDDNDDEKLSEFTA